MAPPPSAAETGHAGEELAAQWLSQRGFHVLARNVRVGRLEIDLIARRGGLLVFCEVKAAKRNAAVGPVERLSVAQRQRVRRAAARWLEANRPPGVRETRLDAAFVRLGDADAPAAELQYFEGAF